MTPSAIEPDTDVCFRTNKIPVSTMDIAPINIQWVDGMGGKLAQKTRQDRRKEHLSSYNKTILPLVSGVLNVPGNHIDQLRLFDHDVEQ